MLAAHRLLQSPRRADQVVLPLHRGDRTGLCHRLGWQSWPGGGLCRTATGDASRPHLCAADRTGAERIVEGKKQYGWFEDVLGPDETFETRFGADHISTLRKARKNLGDYIIYLSHKYPGPDVLMSNDEISYIHQNLVQASHVADSIKNSGIPELAIITSENMKRLEGALNKGLKAEKAGGKAEAGTA